MTYFRAGSVSDRTTGRSRSRLGNTPNLPQALQSKTGRIKVKTRFAWIDNRVFYKGDLLFPHAY